LGKIDLGANAAWVLILFLTTLGLIVYRIICRIKSRGSAQGASPRLDQPSTLELGRTPMKVTGVIKLLVVFAVLRFFTQVVNTSSVWLGEHVMGAFAEMLVFENVLEHGQLVILLIVLIADKEVSARVGPLLLPSWNGNGRTARTFASRITMLPEQACNVFSEVSNESGASDGEEIAERASGDEQAALPAEPSGRELDADREPFACMEAGVPQPKAAQ